MPILNCFLGLCCRRINGSELGQRNRQTIPFPTNSDKHLFLTLLFRRHPNDINFILNLQGWDSTFYFAYSGKRKLQFLFGVRKPTIACSSGPYASTTISIVMRFSLSLFFLGFVFAMSHLFDQEDQMAKAKLKCREAWPVLIQAVVKSTTSITDPAFRWYVGWNVTFSTLRDYSI